MPYDTLYAKYMALDRTASGPRGVGRSSTLPRVRTASCVKTPSRRRQCHWHWLNNALSCTRASSAKSQSSEAW